MIQSPLYDSMPDVLSVSGALDPITGGKEGLESSIGYLKKQGCTSIKNIVYPNMKHEVLNEENKLDVYHDIESWMKDEIQKYKSNL